MPLPDRDHNVGGRNSRASNMSNNSRGPTRPFPAMTKADQLASAPGVMSMLRSSTELGTESLIMPGSRFSAHNRSQNRHSGATSRVSTGSGRSQSSKRTSIHRAWPSASSNSRRRSITSNFSNLAVPHYLDTMPPSLANLPDLATMPPPAPYFRDGGGRSLSLTNTTSPSISLANYRSLTSLRGSEPYQRPRSPYRYPTRLKRPGYRPSSPALSDVTGLPPPKAQHARLGSGLRMPHGPHTPLAPLAPHPTQMSHGYHGPQEPHGPYLPHGVPLPQMTRQGQARSGLRRRSTHSVASVGLMDQMPGTFPPSLPASRQGTPSIPDQSLPSLTPTHPSSTHLDLPSSEPPSSSPTTPHDMLGPSNIKQSIMPNRSIPIREHSSVSANAPIYYDYSEPFEEVEQVEKKNTQISQDTTTAPTPMGFVQRIKILLEDRQMTNTPTLQTPAVNFLQLPTSEAHELPASPVIHRITRDLILANLDPVSSDVPQLDTQSRNQIQHHNVELPTTELCEAPQSTTVAPYSDKPESSPGHEKQESTASEVVSYRSSTTTATCAIDYALHYSMPMSTNNLDSEMNVFIPDEQTNENSTPAAEEPNDPVTVVTAEVEVAAPTPTQSHWSLRFQTPADLSRVHSTYIARSVYSGGLKDLNTRFSTPTTRSGWPRLEQNNSSPQRNTNCADVSVPLVVPLRTEQVESSSSSPPTPQFEVEQPTLDKQIEESPVSPFSERDAPSLPLQNLSPGSPLASLDRDSNRRDSNTTTYLANIWSEQKPIPKRADSPASTGIRTSIKDYDSVREPAQDNNSTTDLRFSALRPIMRPLGDVKEEPSLEFSSVDLRASTFKFPLPQRKSSLAHFEEFRLSRDSRRNTSGDSNRDSAFHQRFHALSKRPHLKDAMSRPPSGTLSLADMRAIPSLNFSHVDLFSKLNEELGLRQNGAPKDMPDLFVPVIQRPTSCRSRREKSCSFFHSLEEMTVQHISQIETGRQDGEIDETERPGSSNVISRISRPFSPDELIAELDRISIPSIYGLTQRLSELIPSLRRYYGESGELLDDNETIKSTLDEIRRLGSHVPSLLFEDGSSESYSASPEQPESATDLSVVAEESTVDSIVKLRGSRPRSASSPGNRPVTPIAELEAPSPAVLRSRSLSDCQAAGTAFVNMERLVHTSCYPRSSPAESRPWNLDTSYPWANGVQNIDISLPAPVLRRDIIQPKPSKLRLRDDASDADDVGAELGSVITTAAHNHTESTGGPTGGSADAFGPSTTRCKISKRSIIGSISRKIGLKTSIDHSGFPIGPDILRGEERAVDPGDRYPTTGLSPPSALNIDEVRSFFSDDSSHGDATAPGVSFRKRLTNLKTRLPPISRAHSAMEHRTPLQGPSIHRSNSLFIPNDGSKSIAGSTAVVYGDGVGMPKTEFRAKKLVERMKTLWYRGGELLRALSGKKNPPRPQHDWDDSGISANWSDG